MPALVDEEQMHLEDCWMSSYYQAMIPAGILGSTALD